MSEIKEGEYVRTENGIIGKFKGYSMSIVFAKDNIELDNYKIRPDEDDIKAHSKNIIDLIEVGDYVNGCKVYENKQTYLIVYQKVYNSEVDYNYINYDEIKEILTHEQYEQNCYKVGDIECL